MHRMEARYSHFAPNRRTGVGLAHYRQAATSERAVPSTFLNLMTGLTLITLIAACSSSTPPEELPREVMAPSDLTVVVASDSQIGGAFVDNADNEELFSVFRDRGSGYVEHLTLPANQTTFIDADLEAEMTYFYRVRAANSEARSEFSNTDSATTPPDTVPTYPNQPPGYDRFAEIDFTELPPIISFPHDCDFAGMLLGCADREHSEHWTLESVPDAPQSPNGVMRVIFREGLPPGTGPGIWDLWDDLDGLGDELSEMYVSAWVRIPTSDFETISNLVKLFGFFSSGEGGVDNIGNTNFIVIWGGAVTQLMSEWTLGFHQQNFLDREEGQNVTNERVFTAGEWHQLEYVATLNDIGLANGTFRLWMDGTLLIDLADVVFRDAAHPRGFWKIHWNPVWGGGVGGDPSKSRDDFFDIDHVYMSGIVLQ